MKRKPPEKKVCPACGKETETLCRYCGACGASMRLSKNEYYKTFSKGRKTVHLLSMLPTGLLTAFSLYPLYTLIQIPIALSLWMNAPLPVGMFLSLYFLSLYLLLLFSLPMVLAIITHKKRSIGWAVASLLLLSTLLLGVTIETEDLFMLISWIYLCTPLLQIILWGIFRRDYKNYVNGDKNETENIEKDSEE